MAVSPAEDEFSQGGGWGSGARGNGRGSDVISREAV